MAKAKQILTMIRSHASRDDASFLAVAEQMALDAEKVGHRKLSEAILRLVASARAEERRQDRFSPVPIAKPRGALASLLHASYPTVSLPDLVVGSEIEGELSSVVREHEEWERLAERGLRARRKLLFAGPPGTGKTMSAAALAGALSLPLFVVLLDGVISKYLGETAAKLRLIFDSMTASRGVYLFDEVDALATKRSNQNDVGEARRMLTSFLQFLDDDTSTSIVIAATNHQGLLDPAIFRRFDAVLGYRKPTWAEAQRVLRNNLVSFELDAIRWGDLEDAVEDLSQADLVGAAEDASRAAVLNHDGHLDSSVVRAALLARKRQLTQF